ncbi:PREDICTED: zinc finger CCHC domain-containing protein 4-like [Priapulus caudatus]|uniref:Zinc finger CCHC domain-containing protein 4-like n=1 Tax=Priapulus caudatus TaxID=37621 RepID=A0ABM1DPW2_PRICU|nr:PREDICTED: zinc finger CCHC domain-containing protein 4-like [Priapulus caudatus]
MNQPSNSGVLVVSVDWDCHPSCQHGPTVLFQRYTKDNSTSRQFYACSACRDRKDCSFFQWADDKLSCERLAMRKQVSEAFHSEKSMQEEQQLILRKCLDSKDYQNKYCTTCGLLLPPGECLNHVNHNVKNVSVSDLTQPTAIIRAHTNNKMEAQYFFSRQTLSFLMATFKELSIDSVLCIGTPTIHEVCVNQGVISSYLLDIDQRYEQFYPVNKFSRFNMFNRHFFNGEKGADNVDLILHKQNLAIIIDPPFGGLAELLGGTLQHFMKRWKTLHAREKRELPIFWVFPYFLEEKVKENLPNVVMLDYVVDYANHSSFKSDKKRKSPVRIFTNVCAERIALPKEQGYCYCNECHRWVTSENKHCSVCNVCPSKDGNPWKHCFKCSKCVKGSREHCDTCQHCVLPKHICGELAKSKAGCHMCGDIGHKKRDCPKVTAASHRGKWKKRSLGQKKGNAKKMKR